MRATCAAVSCGTSDCLGCGNPGPTGCYREPSFLGACEWFWSSTAAEDGVTAWSLNFKYASFAATDLVNALNFRCVR